MTDAELDAIQARHKSERGSYDGSTAHQDRGHLLRQMRELRAAAMALVEALPKCECMVDGAQCESVATREVAWPYSAVSLYCERHADEDRHIDSNFDTEHAAALRVVVSLLEGG